MRRLTCLSGLLFSLSAQAFVSPAAADTFGNGANSFEIEFETIGNPGNPPDTTGSPNSAGSVPYEYRIGKYEISEQMVTKANALGELGITKDTRGPDKPATSISWFEAARFVNWLNTSTGHMSAYKFDAGGNFQLWNEMDAGYNPANRFRNSLASYFLPSADEWYKAAFYDPASGVYWDYPTGSNAPPIPAASGTAPGTAVYHQELSALPADIMQAGGLSPYGTIGQGGNVYEWHETQTDLLNDIPLSRRILRGGFWNSTASALSVSASGDNVPSVGVFNVGFRIGCVIPEPSTLALIGIAFLPVLSLRPSSFERRFQNAQRF